jgi:tRNA modification GTPase
VVAIAGPPNAGKSSLLNRLARREAAIVSPQAGTTRDVIEVHLDLAGYPVTVVDTAGIRDAEDAVEREGVRRALERVRAADLVLWITDASADAAAEPSGGGAATWVIRNKVDRIAPRRSAESDFRACAIACRAPIFWTSMTTGEGVEGLLSAVAAWAQASLSGAESGLVSRARHRAALMEAKTALERAMALGAGGPDELLAEELRLAARALGRLTGRIDVEDLLDVIFREFCVGK